jgi:hypothetical protein
MLRKIIAGILIFLSSILLGLSLAGIGLVWMYKQPLVQTSVFQLRVVDREVARLKLRSKMQRPNWNGPCVLLKTLRKAWQRSRVNLTR